MAAKPQVSFRLDKLVRGKLPEMMREMGQEPEVTVLEGEDLQRALIAKVAEEVAELDPNDPSYQKELADLLQAMKDLIAVSGGEAVIERLRQADEERRGGFLPGQFITRLQLEPDERWVEYYRREPKKYPEG